MNTNIFNFNFLHQTKSDDSLCRESNVWKMRTEIYESGHQCHCLYFFPETILGRSSKTLWSNRDIFVGLRSTTVINLLLKELKCDVNDDS